MSGEWPDFDLLGDPIPEGFGRRGRPPHVVTEEKRKLVIVLQAFDWSLEKIAAAMSVTAPTLRKHYFRELKAREEARARVEAKTVSALMAEVEKGNVSAIDKMFKRLDRHDQRIAAAAMASRGPQPKAEKLGKKEARKRAAHDVDGIFAPPAPPSIN